MIDLEVSPLFHNLKHSHSSSSSPTQQSTSIISLHTPITFCLSAAMLPSSVSATTVRL